MTRRLPHTSARRPTNGAASATAAVVAVTVRLTWKWLAEDFLEQRQQRLGGVQAEKRREAGKYDRDQ
jgi:hypothetical protein